MTKSIPPQTGSGRQPAGPARIPQRILEKLEWPALTTLLAAWTQTDDGRTRCLDLVPDLATDAVRTQWTEVSSIRDVVRLGNRAPIGTVVPLAGVFKAASVGHVLTGVDFRAVFDLLQSVRRVHAFATEMSAKSSTLRRLRGQIYPLPNLAAAIEKTCAPNGSLLDTASPELQRLRKLKLSLTRHIEEQIKRLLRETEVEAYIQDDFFTMRSERYVIPMRLDGRGRIKGSIIDTSESGQTLFIEPAAITPLNEELLELDLAEKLEILRIFRDLTNDVAAELTVLRGNYDTIIELDFLQAHAQLAVQLDAGPVELLDQPGVDLRSARHPLILKYPLDAEGNPDSNPARALLTAIGSHIGLEPEQTCLVVSGPNAGGKTVVLKTVGILHLMARAGMLIPADAKSRMFLFENFFVEMGDGQSLAASLSTFSGHMLGLKPIVERAGPRDLVLLDELAVGTEPQTGAAIGQAILESLAARRATCVATTHFDNLKSLPVSDPRFRNGAMEYSLTNMQPTYKLLLDVPGQSHGIELARQMGIPDSIVDRATTLRGGSLSALDAAVTQLMTARDAARERERELNVAKLEADAERARWETEREMLAEARRKASRQVAERYESELTNLRVELDEASRQMRETWRGVQKAGADATDDQRQTFLDHKARATKLTKDFESRLGELGAESGAGKSREALPGFPCSFADLAIGVEVHVLPVKKSGAVVKVGASAEEPIEVQVGIIKLRVPLHDLRLLRASAQGPAPRSTQTQPARTAPQSNATQGSAGKSSSKDQPETRDAAIGFVLQTPTNTVDLRGKEREEGLEVAMRFLDKAVLRGEPAIIVIHGYGTGSLKTAVRRALELDCPYDVRFRPGEANEGGDGVTVIQLRG